jgi:gluconate 5-dehydrogenase
MADSLVDARPLEELMRLDGRNGLVIGGSGGIGGAIARTLASLGANVGLAARNVERCALLAGEIEVAHGVRTAAIRADAGVREGIVDAVDAFRTAIGPVDLLVFNAGTFAVGEVWEITPERWRRVFALNVDGPFFAVQAAFEDLRDRGGNVIIVTSVGGMQSFPRKISKVVPYTTSKAASMHLTRDLAAQLGDFGIRVNSLAPGQIDSGLTATLTDEQKRAMTEKVPLGRLGTPGDLTGAIAFLATDLSAYVTGQTLVVDGGLTLV